MFEIRYVVLKLTHGYQVQDMKRDCLCMGTWTLHEHVAIEWARVLNEAWNGFKTATIASLAP